MSSSVSSFNPLNYLNQLLGSKPLTDVANVLAPATPASGTSASSLLDPTQAPSLNNLLQLPADVLAVLQGTDSNSANGTIVSNLFGSGAAATDPLYSTLLTQYSILDPVQEAVRTAPASLNSPLLV